MDGSWDLWQVLSEFPGVLDGHARRMPIRRPRKLQKKEEERKRCAQEFEENWKAYAADPKNHLGDCGVITDDFWDEGCDNAVVPNMIVNDVPIEKLGEFGEELMKRAHDGDKHGLMEPEDLAKAIDENTKCSIVISMYHDEEEKEETADNGSETV